MSRKPVSTYRVQLEPLFGFARAREVVRYLDTLGITDLYCSPFLAAEAGSTHGYNIIDYGRLNPELGSAADFDALSRALGEHGMGLVADFVPNHMGIGTSSNQWWNDVLENGPSSRFASYFDIDWAPPKPSLQNRVLLPILGRQYGEALESAEIALARQGGSFYARYYERTLPVRFKSVAPLLQSAVARAGLAASDPARLELESILLAISNLPPQTGRDDVSLQVRANEIEVIRRRLGELFAANSMLATAVDAVITDLNSRPSDPSSFDGLDVLLRKQNYRLSSWQVATEEINYRRFFDVHGLAAIRMESPAVFAAAHTLILRLVAEGKITGIRLDHTDGLYDPAGYFRTLQQHLAEAAALPPADDEERPFYVVAEKILGPREVLPSSWAIHGTTGYDFLAASLGLFIDPRAEAVLTRVYQRFTGERTSYEQVLEEAKRTILRSSLSAELNVLARRLERIADANRRSRDFTLISLTRAISETLVGFHVYRTYVRPDGYRESADEAEVRAAIQRARHNARHIPGQVFQFLADVLLLADRAGSAREIGRETESETRSLEPSSAHPRHPERPRRLEHTEHTERVERLNGVERVEFALKFQQLTGPVMAKSVEDTTFYRYNRLVCLNEVGSDPARFGVSPAVFHSFNALRAAQWPFSMSALSTHDTKRGEDVRARLAVLTEMPDAWRRALSRWSRFGRTHKTLVDGEPAPSRNDEYLFYQTVVGAWPLTWSPQAHAAFRSRMVAYMTKAAREAKRETSWVNPSQEYESALARFVETMLGNARFTAEVRSFSDSLSPYGAVNGLAQTLLKLWAPGVADMYQGSEIWDQRLVDPDNRAPIDYEALSAMLADIRGRSAQPAVLVRELLDTYRTGAVKLYVTHVALQARRDRTTLVHHGTYEPLEGPEHVVAFGRRHGTELVVCAVPRFSFRLTQGRTAWPLGAVWGEEQLEMPAGGFYRHLYTDETYRVGERIRLAEVFASFPVALLTRIPD